MFLISVIICLTYLSVLQRLTNSASVFTLMGAKISSIRMESTILEIMIIDYSCCCLILSIYIIRSLDSNGGIKEYVLSPEKIMYLKCA